MRVRGREEECKQPHDSKSTCDVHRRARKRLGIESIPSHCTVAADPEESRTDE